MPDAAHFEMIIRSHYGARYKKTRGRNGLEYKICCPFCLRNLGKPDTGYHLTMNPDKAVYRCWRCPARGPLTELFKNINWTEKNTFAPPPEPLQQISEPPGVLIPLQQLPNDHLALRYLRNRKFNPAALDTIYGVRYCSEGRSYLGGLVNTTNTIVFPIWMDGKLVGWQSRVLFNPDSLTEEECAAMGLPLDSDGKRIRPPKYFTNPGLEKGRVMFNYDMARRSEIVAVTEGPLDALAVGPCAVATLGKGVSDAQARMLKAYWRLVVILLDPGDADREMQALYNSLWQSTTALIVKLTDYKDPGDAPTAEIWRQIDIAASNRGIALENYNWGPCWQQGVMKV